MMQIEASRVTLPKDITDKVKNRLWQRSYSLSTVEIFDNAIAQFDRYLQYKELRFEDTLKDPLSVIDDFSAWMDRHHSAKTTRTYITFIKKVYLTAGVEINDYKFREQVVLPKIRHFEDDKVDEEQARRILLTIKNQKLKCMLMLMKDTCARPREILGLKLGDFNLTYDPPHLSIPSRLAKNDIPREVFFTTETKTVLMTYLDNNSIKNSSDFVFLKGNPDTNNEEDFQKRLKELVIMMAGTFRETLAKPAFQDMNTAIEKHGVAKRYKIHVYSFKKFAFTKMVDALGELPARAIKGDAEYVFTYYKKSREERAEDYRRVMPKLSLFSSGEDMKVRELLDQELNVMKKNDLTAVLEFIKNGKKAVRE
jgi:integrase